MHRKESKISAIWFSVFTLGVAAFAMVTTEFAPIGLLSQIAANLGQPKPIIGLTVTLYAWGGACSGLFAARLAKAVDCKNLLIALLLVLAVSNFFVMISSTLAALFVARAVGAVAHGIFWALVAATATRIAPPHRMGLATSIVFGGISVASVAGIPIVNFVGQILGWRISFGILGVTCFLVTGLMVFALPKMTIPATENTRFYRFIIQRKDLLPIYAVTAFTSSAHFGAYTFIEPFILRISHISALFVSLLLLSFGAAGFVGNLISGLLSDRFIKPLVGGALITMLLALGGLGWLGPRADFASVLILLIVWGASIAVLFAVLQTWILFAAKSDAMVAAGLHTAVLNVSIGIGSSLGSWCLHSYGLSSVMSSAAILTVPPVFILFFTRNDGRR